MCGKSIKNLVNKVVKLDPLRGGDVILEGMGLPNMFGENTGMFNKAEREKAAAEAASGSGTSANPAAPTTSSDSVQAAVEAERKRHGARDAAPGA